MSKYSEIVGSFLRNGPFPLEADYVFSSEEELIQFYSEPENKAILHEGWFKIVGKGDEQALYWVVEEEDELKFVKLVERIDRDTIYERLTDLDTRLKKEVQDRQDADNEIWGNREEVVSGINSIELLSKAVDKLRTEMSKAVNAISHIIKGDDSLNLDTFVSYLQTLDYPSLEALSKAVKKFLETAGDLDDNINTLTEIQHFLEGYSETDQLKTILEKLVADLMGLPLPSEEFRTLRGIEDFVRLLKSQSKNADDNLQSELDRTQIGVGLSGDGSYNADKETYYLQDATSVMNALKTLDRLIHDNSIKVSNQVGNQIIIKEDGIYHNVDIDITEGILKVLVNGNVIKTYPLAASSILEDGWYDSDTESIILIFKKLDGSSERARVPVGALIREWDIDNNGPSKVVELTREEVISGGPDRLSADVRISSNKNNILEKDGNTLLVRGTTDNITHEGRSLDKVLNDLKSVKHVFNYYSEALKSNLEVGDYFLVLNDEIEENTKEDTEESTDRIYNLVTTVSNVKDGNKYIFAYNNYAMSEQLDTYRNYEEVSNNGNSMIVPIDNDTVQEVELVKSDTGFYLQVGDDQYLTVNNSSDSQNYLKTSSFEDASEFTFVMNVDTTFQITSINTNSVQKYLQFNATKGNERFTFYRTGSQKDFNLYLKETVEKELIYRYKGLYFITDYGIEQIPFYGAIEELRNLLNKEASNRTFEDNKLQSQIDSMKAMINKMKGWYVAD